MIISRKILRMSVKILPKQARKIHYKQVDATNIYGTAKLEELEELHEEGIAYDILPNPHNKN